MAIASLSSASHCLAGAIDWCQTEKKLSKMEKAREREQLLELAMVDMKAFKKLSLEDKRAVR